MPTIASVAPSGHQVSAQDLRQSYRLASRYRSLASALRTQVLDLYENGHITRPNRYTPARVKELQRLLGRSGSELRRPDGSLDAPRSTTTTESLSLATELASLIPGDMPVFRGQGETTVDAHAWVGRAHDVLEAIGGERPFSELTSDDRVFLERELLPFLDRLSTLPPQESFE